MSENVKELSGADKAALFLLSLGPELSSEVMKNLDDETLVEIAKRIPHLNGVESERLAEICKEYAQHHRSGAPIIAPSLQDIQKLLKGVVDEERLRLIMEHLEEEDEQRCSVWKKLSRVKPKIVYSLIKNEKPQTIAIILGQLDAGQASSLLEMFPEEMQRSVVLRMSKIESVSTELIRDIEEALEKQMADLQGGSGLTFDGMVRVVEILKSLDSKITRPILDYLRSKDPELFEQVDSKLLVFEDIGKLTDRDIQAVLKHVSSEDLIKALKGASDELRELFFRNMSQRAAEIMREDMEVMGPVKVSEVEKSQRNILEVARKLDEEGTITLGSQEDLVY